MDEELDITKLKYVLYARKSTDDPQRQVRSIDDQIAECLQLADRLSLHVINRKEPIIERKSAKKPGQRPQFTQMLKDIRQKKYDAILAWAPDRLARNMKEGGEMIDMIDEEQLLDLKFVTHHFTRDPNGKMLLGMAFVLSKQYSDKLSVDVTRGVRRNFAEGKTPTPKHGYIRDENGLYQPDEENFELICKAWQMRKEGVSLELIADYLNNNGYGRKTKTGKIVKMAKQTLTDLFKDPFYYGILISKKTGKEVDLREIYKFTPAITEEEYMEVQRLLGSRKMPYKQKMRATYYPLKMMVVCAFCNNHMYAGASRGGGGKRERYLNYRCDKDYCVRNSKENRDKKWNDQTRIKASVRGKIVFDFIYDFLENGLNFTEKEYKDYLKSITSLTSEKREKLGFELHSLQGRLNAITREMKDVAYKVIDYDKDSTVRKINEDKISELEQEKESLEGKVAKIKEKLVDPQKEILSVEQFLNLSKNATVAVQKGDGVVKDAICRLIFLNLVVDGEKVLSYQAKEPFATLLKHRQVFLSRGQRTRTSDLTVPNRAL